MTTNPKPTPATTINPKHNPAKTVPTNTELTHTSKNAKPITEPSTPNIVAKPSQSESIKPSSTKYGSH